MTLFRISIVLLLALIAAPPSRASESPFCNDCAASRRNLRDLCDYILAKKTGMPTIFVAGYFVRTLVAGYEIFGDRRYLDAAIAHGDILLDKQLPSGYWGTGYGNIYLADTASALAEFMVLDKHVDKARQARYLAALRRHVAAIEKDGLVLKSGALGTGFRARKDGTVTAKYQDEYTVSSALTGGQTLTWMYYKTREDKYRQIGHRAVNWVLDTIRKDGVIPYILKGEFADPNVKGDAENDYNLWDRLPYTNVTYVGEGILTFDLYCGNPQWQAEVRRKFKPVIEYALRTQLADGTWANANEKNRPNGKGPWRNGALADRRRFPGVINVLIWWYQNVEKDARVLEAVRKFDRFVTTPEAARAIGLLHRGPDPDPRAGKVTHSDGDVVTAIAGRALADIVSPGVDTKW